MTDLLEDNVLARWQANPVSFIEEILWTYDIDSQSFAPFKLYDAQREFLKYAWMTRGDGRLLYPQQEYCTIKKTGKTAFSGAHLMTTTLILGGHNAEAYCVANDLTQARGRVFDACVDICKNSPYLKRECEITANRIYFPQTGATITAIPSSDTSIAGAHPTISSLDELWGFSNTRLRRLYEELIPVPTRLISCRLVTSHAGYSGESELLEEIYKDGHELPLIGKDLHAGNGTLFFWSHDRIAPWQTEQWFADMRQQQKRPAQFIRQFENRFVPSETIFIEPSAWDRCVLPSLHMEPANKMLPIWIGIDASVKHDSSAVLAVTYDTKSSLVRQVFHRVFQPSPDDPLDFEATIEATVLELNNLFHIRKVLFDPYQMVGTSQRLARAGIPVEEFAQSVPNLTAASQQLYELINGQGLLMYPDAAMRKAMLSTVAVERSRGWHISKDKQSAKIDAIIALSMACYAAVKAQGESTFDPDWSNWIDEHYETPAPTKQKPTEQQPANSSSSWWRRLRAAQGDTAATDAPNKPMPEQASEEKTLSAQKL